MRWVQKDEKTIKLLTESSMSTVVMDKDENYAVLLLDEWKAKWLSDRYEIEFFMQPQEQVLKSK